MQKYSATTTELNGLQQWSYRVLLCLLLIVFSTASYAASGEISEKQLTAQQNSNAVFIVDLSSPISEIQAEDPEFDKAIDASSRVFQNVLALAPLSQEKSEPKLTQWNWHLVRGPPAHL
ncbi:hypothetical protein V6D52_05170 [Idiomarina loihiensis]|mgnify:CR=1 FL=1|jgi:hypothetical protein|uniref:hypothetical protein n=1 Tax=Idiomarina TaxID=135575 RepID=UPI0003327AF4|nr:hypothetical protein [Idiomarina]AGM36818.1 hypothetical protein K734_09785 [Idiomarina loihiensis GSL 199]MAA62630.1 hypothetical protein [Idiomarina sp.]MBL4855827.1 hypothetical protein [Idiomarina sp.]MRJ44703.1 hypothetical protein [Idiomarina loihiensis]PHQ92009.1 MAG: hypothetical protein COB44_02445 [Idiomarina sp.]|tara:strand:+ start:935 stop:1291 length:357 start_codon:yes stop_codon:yes gene_type:complete